MVERSDSVTFDQNIALGVRGVSIIEGEDVGPPDQQSAGGSPGLWRPAARGSRIFAISGASRLAPHVIRAVRSSTARITWPNPASR